MDGVGLRPSETAAAAYAGLLTGLCLFFRERIPSWPLFVLGNALLLGVILVLSLGRSRVLGFARDWVLVFVIPAAFFLLCPLIHRIHPADGDLLLMALDRQIGGVALLRAASSIETPALTMLAQGLWLSYYALPLVPVVALYARGRSRDFEAAKLVLVLVWLGSFVGYLLVPAEGPGYRSQELGVSQPAWPAASLELNRAILALEGRARDTFPSGHAAIAAATIYLCVRHRLGWETAVVTPLAAGVILSTLFLRYHYLVDVLAGLLLAALAAGAAAAWGPRSRFLMPPPAASP